MYTYTDVENSYYVRVYYITSNLCAYVTKQVYKIPDNLMYVLDFNPLKPELNSIYYLLTLLAHHFLHVSRIRVKSLNFRRLMSYIYIWSTHS